MESSRRAQAREDLGLTTQQEQEKINLSLQKEEQRRQKKELARQKLEGETSYKLVKGLSFVMDKCFGDALVGFFLPGLGDIISATVTVPYLYVSLFKIRSIPLTLAILYNMMLDFLVGLVPYIGDLLDVFYRSYVKNYQLIVGFVEDDEDVIKDVNRSAKWFAVMIAVLGIIGYFVYQLVHIMLENIQAMMGCN